MFAGGDSSCLPVSSYMYIEPEVPEYLDILCPLAETEGLKCTLYKNGANQNFDFNKSSICNSESASQLIFVRTVRTGSGELFSGQCTFFSFFKENAMFCLFWPFSANFGYFVAILRTFWCTFHRPKQCCGVPEATNISISYPVIKDE